MTVCGLMNGNKALSRLCQALNFCMGRSHCLLLFSNFKHHCKSVVRGNVLLQLKSGHLLSSLERRIFGKVLNCVYSVWKELIIFN